MCLLLILGKKLMGHNKTERHKTVSGVGKISINNIDLNMKLIFSLPRMDKAVSEPDLRHLDWTPAQLRRAGSTVHDGHHVDQRHNLQDSLEGLRLLAAPDSPAETEYYQAMDTGILDTDSDTEQEHQRDTSTTNMVSHTIQNNTQSQVSGTPKESVSPTVREMGPLYYQCRSTRMSATADVLVSLSPDETFGSLCESVIERVGSFDSEKDKIKGTFHGCRVRKGGSEVNQAVSMSFDPTDLHCISCNKQHPLSTGNPITVFVSDQNFVENLSALPTKSHSCLNVIRLEDASLEELADFVAEVFEGRPPPDGSVLLFGSASYLHRVGVTCYAQAWVKMLEMVSKKWKNIRICPLIPLIRDDCPGSLARELQELASWFVSVYYGNTSGMSESWSTLSSVLIRNAPTIVLSELVDRYRVALPVNLKSDSSLAPRTFVCTNSRPTVLKGFSKVTIDELLRPLLASLHNNFRLCNPPESYLPRSGPESAVVPVPPIQMVAIGASNLLYTVPNLSGKFDKVADLTKKGWIATKTSVSVMLDQLLATESNNVESVLVFDLFSNFVHRYRQSDDTLSLPFKAGNGYHLGGDVDIVTDGQFKSVFNLCFPLMAAHQQAMKIIVPPAPRYLFTGCCTEKTHCTNIATAGYETTALAKAKHLQSLLKVQVVAAGIKNVWVMDTCYMVDGSQCTSETETLNLLKNIYAKDGVHFKQAGYTNTAHCIMNAADMLRSRLASSASASVARKQETYWRGFVSSVGSVKPSFTAAGYRQNRPQRGGSHFKKPSRGSHFHPYHRGRGGHGSGR